MRVFILSWRCFLNENTFRRLSANTATSAALTLLCLTFCRAGSSRRSSSWRDRRQTFLFTCNKARRFVFAAATELVDRVSTGEDVFYSPGLSSTQPSWANREPLSAVNTADYEKNSNMTDLLWQISYKESCVLLSSHEVWVTFLFLVLFSSE